MNPGSKSFVVLLVGAIALLAFWLATAGGDPPTETPGPDHPTETGAPDEQTPPPALESGAPPRVDEPPETAPPERVEVSPQPPSGAQLEQGVRGVALGPDGRMLADVDVYLMEGHGHALFDALLLQRRGVQVPPVARAITDAEGRFTLGVRRVSGKGYEVRIVSPEHPQRTVPNLTLFEGEWVDLGEVRVEPGVRLSGRVTVQGGGFPVPDARITIATSGALPSLSPTPGREDGIQTITDASGHYELRNVAAGIVTVSAVADGFAKIERRNVQLPADQDTEVHFELPKGMAIDGSVVDVAGRPIPGAKVTAMAISARVPLTLDARSDAEGQFRLIGLVDGPYQLQAIAPGFSQREVTPVRAGATDERIVLDRQGAARLRVESKEGRLVTRFEVVLKSWTAVEQAIGNVPGARVHRVRPGDLVDGAYSIEGIDPGVYAFQIEAKGFAKTFSTRFEVALGGDPPTVVVVMSSGGTLRGRVVGADGAPIAGAEVLTLPNTMSDSPLNGIFGTLIPFRITRTRTQTNTDGVFDLPKLTAGTYQLKIAHADHVDHYVKDLELEESRVVDVPDIRMDRGTEVRGTATLDGQPAGQIKVQIVVAPGTVEPGAPSFHADAITDNEGRFVLRRRLPPGQYEARASRQTLPTPMLQILDFAKTRQVFTIGRGAQTHILRFQLQSQ